MNGRRRVLLVIAAALFVLSCLVPPWAGLISKNSPLTYFDGWHPLFSEGVRLGDRVLEYRTLLVEWAALAVVTAALWAVFGRKAEP